MTYLMMFTIILHQNGDTYFVHRYDALKKYAPKTFAEIESEGDLMSYLCNIPDAYSQEEFREKFDDDSELEFVYEFAPKFADDTDTDMKPFDVFIDKLHDYNEYELFFGNFNTMSLG